MDATTTAWALAGFGAAGAATWLSALAAGMRGASRCEGPWWERARLGWPVRTALAKNTLIAPLVVVAVGFVLGVLRDDQSGRVGASVSAVLAVAAVALVGWPINVRLRDPRPSVRDVARDTLVVLVVLRSPLFFFGVMLLVMPLHWGPGAAITLGAGVAALWVYSSVGIVPTLRLLGALEPADADLERRCRAVAERTGTTMNRVFHLRTNMANAAVLFVLRDVVIFGPARDLPHDEFDALMAHESGHLREPRWTIPIRLLLGSAVLLLVAALPLGLTYGVWAAVGTVLAILALSLVGLRWIRHNEHAADCVAHDHAEDATALARALMSMSRINHTPLVLPSPGSHGHVYDRVAAAGVELDFPRPPRPSRARDALAGLVAAVVYVIVLVVFVVGVRFAT